MLAPDPRFDQIDAMEGREFERAVADLLKLLEFDHVEQTPFFDKGADIVAVKDGVRTAVQVKRWSNPVGVDAVRQLIDGQRHYKCDRGLLVTNSFLTEKALRSAETWNIEVWDRRKLAEYVPGDPPAVNTSVCAHCSRPVSTGVTKWCLSHPGRYAGFVYCPQHQKRSQRRSAGS